MPCFFNSNDGPAPVGVPLCQRTSATWTQTHSFSSTWSSLVGQSQMNYGSSGDDPVFNISGKNYAQFGSSSLGSFEVQAYLLEQI